MNELGKNWLPLIEYSMRCGISTSTVRRHIKAQKLECKLHNGKYYILYGTEKNVTLDNSTATSSVKQNSDGLSVSSSTLQKTLELVQDSLTSLTQITENQFKYKDNVIDDQKKRMQLLEQEISDLKTLVSILESKS
ncbi:MAG: hypothetical protein HYS98_02175 [Deltaproteobacteria bacterium]|nr:hypothetical protein [Deltaproteobacteria bacterium]